MPWLHLYSTFMGVALGRIVDAPTPLFWTHLYSTFMVVALTVFLASLARVAQRLVDKYVFRSENLPPIPDWKRRAGAYIGIVIIPLVALLLYSFNRWA